ncbi:MAG: oligosaccharide flippase family protein [Bacteroidia bacterium]|nr:oligosaccharide flippase family protein [Bacteroidia bacterium]
MNDVLNYFNSRLRNYKFIAVANVYKSVSLSVVQLIFGFFKAGVAGLITGQIISQFSGNYKLFRETIRNKALLSCISKEKMKFVARRYVDFPKYNIWSGLSSQLSLNLIGLFIIDLFSAKVLGYYGFVYRVLGLPTLVIGTSIGQVFLQQASVEKNKTGNTRKIFNSTFKKLLLISVPTGILIFPFIPYLWPVIFGSKWAGAGIYVQILMPMFIIRFITSPLISILSVYEKQRVSMLWQTGNVLIILLLCMSIKWFGFDMKTFLYWLSSISTVYYSLLLYIIYRIGRGENIVSNH